MRAGNYEKGLLPRKHGSNTLTRVREEALAAKKRAELFGPAVTRDAMGQFLEALTVPSGQNDGPGVLPLDVSGHQNHQRPELSPM